MFFRYRRRIRDKYSPSRTEGVQYVNAKNLPAAKKVPLKLPSSNSKEAENGVDLKKDEDDQYYENTVFMGEPPLQVVRVSRLKEGG